MAKTSPTDGMLKARAARALSNTHHVNRGPRTKQARQRITLALEAGRSPSSEDVEQLEMAARLARKHPAKEDMIKFSPNLQPYKAPKRRSASNQPLSQESINKRRR